MGDPALGPNNAGSAQSTTGTQQSYLNMYGQYLPQVANSANQAGLTAQQQANPSLDALNLQEAQQYAVPNAQVGQAVGTSNANANTALINGAGGAAATAGQALNEKLNPNYYSTLGAAATGAKDALGTINLTGLSPGEAAATERSLNQNNVGTGNLGLLNPTNTISNAINFGGAFNNKLGIMNNAVNSDTGVANAASGNAGYSPVGTALSTANNGTTFTAPQIGTTASPFSTASNMGSNLLGDLSGTANANLAPLATSSYQNSALNENNLKSADVASSCCFIFLQSYNGILPAHVRVCRDYFYSIEPRVAKGYKRMAKYLVPLMKKSSIISNLVNKLMVEPITKYGGWLTNTPSYSNCRSYSIYKKFWFNTWSILGGI